MGGLLTYPNIELKLLAFYLESIGHPSMADVFRAGADLHRESAAGIFGIDSAAITDEQRQRGKTFNFSIVYGGGIPTLIRQLGVEPGEALEMLRAYHARWPGLGWARKNSPAAEGTLIYLIQVLCAGPEDKLYRSGVSRGYIKTLYGRHLHPRAMHAALNNLCQGCAGDLMKWAMVRVHQGLLEGGFRSHIVNMVHDELMLDCARDELEELNQLLPEWMTDPRIDSVVPIRPDCDVSFGTWADKAPWNEVMS